MPLPFDIALDTVVDRDHLVANFEDLDARVGTGGIVAKRKSTDQTSIVATAADCTDLSFVMAANEVFAFCFDIAQSCNNTGGVKFAITVPSGATLTANATGIGASVGVPTSSRITTSGTLTSAFNTLNNTGNATAGWTRISGTVLNSTTAGTVALQFAAGTATQSAVVYAGSSLVAHKVS